MSKKLLVSVAIYVSFLKHILAQRGIIIVIIIIIIVFIMKHIKIHWQS